MRRRPNDDVLTRLARAEEDIRKLKLFAFGGGSGGGGGGGPVAIAWNPLTDIWTPATGTRASTLGPGHPNARYAVDENFLYLGGNIEIDAVFGVDIDTTSHPRYGLGDIIHSPIIGSRPTSSESTNSWLFPAIIDGASPGTVCEMGLSMPYAGSGFPGSFTLEVDADDPAITGPVTVSLDGVALPWQIT